MMSEIERIGANRKAFSLLECFLRSELSFRCEHSFRCEYLFRCEHSFDYPILFFDDFLRLSMGVLESFSPFRQLILFGFC